MIVQRKQYLLKTTKHSSIDALFVLHKPNICSWLFVQLICPNGKDL